MKLIPLKNGEWLDPSTITAIKPIEKTVARDGDIAFVSCVYVANNGVISIVNFSEYSQAVAYVRELAKTVNEACNEPVNP